MKLIPGISKFAAACVTSCALAVAIAANAQDAAPAQQTHGIAVANMDRSVKPGDDFYQYASGDWIKRTEIPADRAGVSVWDTLDDLSNKNTAALIADIAKSNAPAGSGARKVADLTVFMHQGKVWESGPSQAVLSEPKTPELKSFVGVDLK